ncbi:hypothetical protein EDD36DRAFT_124919 [Exophiala viscosa]|uniref:Uncharacterized protein n=1 Tax=Exophiala viscosa TaxID=2486360 RepID=A0AAN6E3V7_9EURO|nr:hypothetical protein EDD36DRAFT_124919 [Exophiala viscosa]
MNPPSENDADSLFIGHGLSEPRSEAEDSGRHSGSSRSTENPFSCNVCKQSYSRVDHLARHYRSHTHEKPFVCETCDKAFARVDLLKRHALGHDNDLSSSNKRARTTSQKATHSRVAKACIACAEVKLRCEGVVPCGRCKHKGLTCEYAPSRNRRSSSQVFPTQQQQTYLQIEKIQPQLVQSDLQLVEFGTSHVQYHEAPADWTLQISPQQTLVEVAEGQPQNDTYDVGKTSTHTEIQMPTHLPTPTTFDHDSVIMPLGSPFFQSQQIMGFDEFSFFDVLRDSMTPITGNAQSNSYGSEVLPTFPRDVLDFNIDSFVDIPTTQPFPGFFPNDQEQDSGGMGPDGDRFAGCKSGYVTPGAVPGSITLGQKAFRESMWLWTPALGDHGQAEQSNLSLSYDDATLEAQQTSDSAPLSDQLTLATRDRILAMVLSTCEPDTYCHVVSCFPSPKFLSNLLNTFVAHHLRQDTTCIHIPTMKINEEGPEILGSMISFGASVSRVPEVRKLGFALQESVRMALPVKFESDNRQTRELRLLQAYVLYLNIGLWSGNRRKIEIAESFALPLITMIRRAGHFRWQRHPDCVPEAHDDEKTTEAKWHSWVQAESWKRLALHLVVRDTETSMSLLNRPIISYAELSLELPFTRDMWFAKTAKDWRGVYLSQMSGMQDRLPSLRTCIEDAGPIFKIENLIDMQMTLSAIISSIWSLIWQYREMKTTFRHNDKVSNARGSGCGGGSLITSSLYQEITQAIQHLRLNTAEEWGSVMNPSATLLLELGSMHLHVSLGDIQTLLGKEGEEAARKVLLRLSTWAESSESRQALYHAGQVIRMARQFPLGALRDAPAVAVYHASLVLWAYAVLSKVSSFGGGGGADPFTNRASKTTPDVSSDRAASLGGRTSSVVLLDGEDTPALQRFLVLGKGIPSIRRSGADDHNQLNNSNLDIPLSDPSAVMSTITSILQSKNWDDERGYPPLVSNLSKLMRALGSAAAGKRRR